MIWETRDQLIASGTTRSVSSSVISRTDAVMSRTSRGLCLEPTCQRLADDSDGLCTDHREEDR